jgi:hypothetical protein
MRKEDKKVKGHYAHSRWVVGRDILHISFLNLLPWRFFVFKKTSSEAGASSLWLLIVAHDYMSYTKELQGEGFGWTSVVKDKMSPERHL